MESTNVKGFGLFKGPYNLLCVHNSEEEAWKEAKFSCLEDEDQKILFLQELEKEIQVDGEDERVVLLKQMCNHLPLKLWLKAVVFMLPNKRWAQHKGLTVHPVECKVHTS